MYHRYKLITHHIFTKYLSIIIIVHILYLVIILIDLTIQSTLIFLLLIFSNLRLELKFLLIQQLLLLIIILYIVIFLFLLKFQIKDLYFQVCELNSAFVFLKYETIRQLYILDDQHLLPCIQQNHDLHEHTNRISDHINILHMNHICNFY